MTKVVLISQFPLPFHKIGSWTTMYRNYLEDEKHLIDYIICEKPLIILSDLHYSFVENHFVDKIKKKFKRNPYFSYLKALMKILNDKDKYIIQVVDNFGIVTHLQKALLKKGVRSNCHIQFFYHGFSPFVKNIEQAWFFEYIDEMVLLTYQSYIEHKSYYTSLPIKFSVLHNGIDTTKFFRLDPQRKIDLRNTEKLSNEKIFVWCSQDRPKKGLQQILRAWKEIEKKYNNVQLWIIGVDKEETSKTIRYLGRIDNDLLPRYLQMSDVYLFPSLWQEGFGMSLIEALHCGNYCIASDNGGISEVLHEGKYGRLIKYPNIVDEWVEAIIEYLEKPLQFEELPSKKYSHIEWNNNMNEIINKAKFQIS